MQITGTITNAGQASAPTGQNQVRYQDVVITDQDGYEHVGRIGSKQGYQAGTPICVTVEVKQGRDGPYDYFRKYNPQYQGQQQGPQNTQQGVSHPPHGTNGGDATKNRSMALAYAKDLVVAEQIGHDRLWEAARDFTAFITSGVIPPIQAPQKPMYTGGPVEGQTPDSEIPF